MRPQNIGFDTTHLRLPADAVKLAPRFVETLGGSFDFKVERNLILCLDDCGFPLTGSRAWHNSPNFKLNLSPAGWLLIFSASDCSGDNSVPLGSDGLRGVSERIAAELRDAGFDADLLAAEVKRFDVSRNIELPHSVPAYIDLWRGAAFPPTVTPRFDGAHSFMYSLSTSVKWPRQWGIYDKGKEREQKILKAQKCRRRAGYSNLMRAEMRFRYGAVGDALGVACPTLGDLLRPSSLDAVVAAYRASAGDNLLSMLSNDSGLSPADSSLSSELCARFEQLAGRHSLAGCRAKGFDVALLLAFGFDGACEFIERNYFPEPEKETKRQRANRLSNLRREKGKLRAGWAFLQAGKPVASGASHSELVRELRAAILA